MESKLSCWSHENTVNIAGAHECRQGQLTGLQQCMDAGNLAPSSTVCDGMRQMCTVLQHMYGNSLD